MQQRSSGPTPAQRIYFLISLFIATACGPIRADSRQLGGAAVSSGKKVFPRLEINTLMEDPRHRNLFIWALRRQHQKRPTDPTSYYQLMGLHGLPFKPYSGITRPGFRCNSTEQWCGYCHHGDVLFPTWHRGYLLFLEQHLRREAAALARQFGRAVPRQALAWRRAAATLRLPYWDFASEAAAQRGIPPFFVQESLPVLSPTTGRPVNISNPLRQYRFPVDTGEADDDFPLFTRRGMNTVRWPDAQLRTNVSALNASVMLQSGGTWRAAVQQLLAEPDWFCFSNHDAPLKFPQRCSALASFEFAHDLAHRGLGGPKGHYSQTRIAAFDPLFMLHHVSMDRLLAMWQAAHPDTWVIEGTTSMGTQAARRGSKVGADTPLVPFYKVSTPGTPPARWNASAFHTSVTLRRIASLGYSYPDV